MQSLYPIFKSWLALEFGVVETCGRSATEVLFFSFVFHVFLLATESFKMFAITDSLQEVTEVIARQF